MLNRQIKTTAKISRYTVSCVHQQDVNSHSFTVSSVVLKMKYCSGYGLDIALFLGLTFFNCSGKPGNSAID